MRLGRLTLTLALGVLASACQTTMSLEEAKRVTATFGGAAFVPPPRTINDITAILDQQRRVDSEAPVRAVADATPPDTSDPAALADFFFKRGLAAGQIGRTGQEIADLTRAATYSHVPQILHYLGMAELRAGNEARHIEYQRQALAVVPSNDAGWLITINAVLTMTYAARGELRAAEAALAEAHATYSRSSRWRNQRPEWVTSRQVFLAHAEAALLDARGKHTEAETLLRRGLASLTSDPYFARHFEAALERLRRGEVTVLAGDPFYFRQTRLDEAHSYLARNLMRQGRLLEAENEARQALLGALIKRGRYSAHTAGMLYTLVRVLIEQGRYAEGERLARSLVDIYEAIQAAPDSRALAMARGQLVKALEAQGRDHEALAEYDAMRVGVQGQVSSHLDARDVVNSYAEALLRTGDIDRALEVLGPAVERSRTLRGERDGDTPVNRRGRCRTIRRAGLTKSSDQRWFGD